MPSPVRADTAIACFSWRSNLATTNGSAMSALLMATISGMAAASTSASTPRTALSWASGLGVGAIDDMHDQIGLPDLLKGRTERLDQLVRKMANEAQPCP